MSARISNRGEIVGRAIDQNREFAFLLTPLGCAADLTGDGAADVFDLLAYLNLWFAQDAAADRTGDAVIDVFDLLVYLEGWFAGC